MSEATRIVNADGTYSQRTAIKNDQATAENTIVALGISATYTGILFSTEGYAKITGTVFADQAGTLYIDQSSNGTNWDLSTSVAVTASAGVGFSIALVATSARLRYVNGAIAQTVFRLYSFLRRV